MAGNPGRVPRRRFERDVIRRLIAIAWWTWSIEHILRHQAEICGGDLAALEAAMPEGGAKSDRPEPE
ncbi:MAG: hypothetical protein CML66_14745 [Rhodobacteraceae bacterium]|nr:hypothetical protein [Paracoccaceae bacterium]MAY47174.1 hypothetical protein [Paracoccaceae bacterium]